MLAGGLLLVSAGVFFAGAVSGATGMAFPLIAGPIFLVSFEQPQAVAMTALCSLTGQLFSIALLRRAIDYQFRPLLIIPGLCAVPLGTIALAHCGPSVVRTILGTLIVASGLWSLLKAGPAIIRRTGVASEICVGLTGGLTGGLVGASAVAPAIWCSWQGIGKEHQRAITQPYILAMQGVSLISLALWGELTGGVCSDYAAVFVPLLLGVATGVSCFHALSSASITRAVLLVVTASGFALLLA